MTRSVHVTDLCLRRPAFTLGPVSFTVPAGGRLAIVGPSGSGKTTLLRCLAGLEQPTAGTIAVGDTVVTGNGVHLPPDRRGVGLVFQDGALWPNMTALQAEILDDDGVAHGTVLTTGTTACGPRAGSATTATGRRGRAAAAR